MKGGVENVRAVIVLVGITSWMAWATLSEAAITSLGDVTPIYDNSDPWNVDGLLTIGTTGEATLTVSAGSGLIAGESVVGSEAGSAGHLVLTGAGTTWQGTVASVGGIPEIPLPGGGTSSSTSITAIIGRHGMGDVTLSDGAKVTADRGYIDLGYWPDGVGSLTVTGPDSVWNDIVRINIGRSGTGTMVISNGASMTSAGPAVIGHGDVTVQDPGSVWRVGGLYVQHNLLVSAGGRVESEYAHINSSSPGYSIATITGPGSLWQNERYLVVGHDAYGRLKVENGAQVVDANAFVGWREGGNGLVQVTGAGSTWDAGEELHVGAGGEGTLSIEGGGRVTNRTGILGTEATGVAAVTVTGPGSLWDNAFVWDNPVLLQGHGGALYVGQSGHGILEIGGGGRVISQTGSVGTNATGKGEVVVDGSNSRWENNTTMEVGRAGVGRLALRNGGKIMTREAIVAVEPGSEGQITVEGTGSELEVEWGMILGSRGDARMSVSGGGRVQTMSVTMGAETGSTATVTVTGANSGWAGWGSIHVGEQGRADLLVSDGALVYAQGIMGIGTRAGGTGTVVVTGAGSGAGGSPLQIGLDGGRGSMTVTDGATGGGSEACVGVGHGSLGEVVVSGPGSSWGATYNIWIGDYYGEGRLTVSDGAQVETLHGFIGSRSGSIGYVVVTGADSLLRTSHTLYVGGDQSGPGGTAFLGIYNGGLVDGNNVTIWPTGTLEGSGTLRANRVLSFGTIRPGASIGTLTVDGNLDLATDGLLEIEIDNDGNSDKVFVTGEFAPGIGHVKPVPIETISGERQYTVVEAGSILWPLITVVDSFNTALLYASLTRASFEEPDVAVLRVMAIPFDHPGIVQTNNQRSLGSALQQIVEQGGNAVTLALQQLDTLEQVRGAYDQLSGQTTPSLAPISIEETTSYVSIVSARLRTARMDLPGYAGLRASAPASGWDGAVGTDALEIGTGRYTFALGNGTPYLGDQPWGIWGNGYGLFGNRESKSGVPGYQDSIYGAALGLDYRFTPRWLLGLTGGYAEGDIDYAASRNSSDISSTHVGLYGGYDRTDWYLHSILAYADLDYETHRFVDLTGARLEGEPSGHALTGYLEGGLNWSVRKLGLVRPLASVQLSSLHIGSFTETGGADSLHFGANSYQSCRGALGVELIRQLFEHPDGCRTTLDLRGRWVHEFGDTQAAVDAQFVGAPGVVFRVSDASVSRDSAILGAGLDTWFSRATGLFLDYGVELGSENTIHALSAGLEHRW